jgi:hypothetical protein
MAIVLTRRSPHRKPAGQPVLNWSHPLANGLVACVVLGAQRNLVTGGAVTVATGTAGKLGQEGLILDGTSVRYEALGLRPVGSALTLWGLVAPQGSGGRMAFAYGNEPNGQAAIRVKSNGSSNWSLHGWSNDHDSSTPVVNGRRVAVGASLPASGNFGMYLDGQPILAGATFAYNGSTHAIAIGGGPDIAVEAWNGVIELVAVWDRALSAAEHQWLAIEPWALLAAPRQWAVKSAAGGATLSVSANVITLTAPTATVAPGASTQAAGVNTITLTAPTATLQATIALAAGLNAITLTPPTATAAPGAATLTASPNSITFTAPTATVSVGANFLAAGVASITFVNPTATVAAGASTRAAGVNSITFTAPSAAVSVPAPAMGEITMTGVENLIGGSATLSALAGSVDMGTPGGSIAGSVIGGSIS